jgi:hypothetical protein
MRPIGSRITGMEIEEEFIGKIVHSIITVLYFIINHKAIGKFIIVSLHRARLAILDVFKFIIMTQSMYICIFEITIQCFYKLFG